MKIFHGRNFVVSILPSETWFMISKHIWFPRYWKSHPVYVFKRLHPSHDLTPRRPPLNRHLNTQTSARTLLSFLTSSFTKTASNVNFLLDTFWIETKGERCERSRNEELHIAIEWAKRRRFLESSLRDIVIIESSQREKYFRVAFSRSQWTSLNDRPRFLIIKHLTMSHLVSRSFRNKSLTVDKYKT